MATSVTFNGTTYSIPANREPRGWGTSLSSFLVDVANSSLSKAGGSFTLTADANFGSSYGLVAKYIKSVSSNIAASGVVRLANTDKIAFRNNANGADLSLGVSTGDRLQFESVNIPTISSTDALTNKTIVAASNTITTASTGNLSATELNAALAELQTDIDTRATSAAPVITGGATVRGTLLLQNTAGAQPELQLSEDPDNGTNKVTIKAPASLSGDYTLTLPSDDGGSNQVLQTDGSGGLSWATVASTVTTTEGDIIYRGASADQRLAGNTATTKKFLRQVGTGSASAAPSWEEVDVVKGQAGSTAISAGYVGEVKTSTGSGVTAGTTSQYKTIASISGITAGIYMVSGGIVFNYNGASSADTAIVAISGYTDNTTTDHTSGFNVFQGRAPTSSDTNSSITVPTFTIRCDGSNVYIGGFTIAATTIHLKGRITYTGTTPTMSGTFTLWRIA